MGGISYLQKGIQSRGGIEKEFELNVQVVRIMMKKLPDDNSKCGRNWGHLGSKREECDLGSWESLVYNIVHISISVFYIFL